MKLKTLVNLFTSAEAKILLGIMRDANKFYRISFVATAFQEGLYQVIGDGTSSLETIAESLGITENHDGLKAWLDLGVSLGELTRDGSGYRLVGWLSRQLLSPENDSVLALLEEIADLHYLYIRRTPELLREGRRFPFSTIDAPMIARGSRTLEPFVSEAMEQTVPQQVGVRLLEIGCGSAIYIRLACRLNSSLSALGLELDPEVAEMARQNINEWGLQERVRIEILSVLDFKSEEPFDLITLHNNIYYFSVGKRVALLKRLFSMLSPGGQVLITSGCLDGSPVMHALNIECAMTEGMGVLPDVNGLLGQLEAAGFVNVRSKKIMPFANYYAFWAVRRSGPRTIKDH